jgi:hypothetical protein
MGLEPTTSSLGKRVNVANKDQLRQRRPIQFIQMQGNHAFLLRKALNAVIAVRVSELREAPL